MRYSCRVTFAAPLVGLLLAVSISLLLFPSTGLSSDPSAGSVRLTPAERAWLDAHPVLRLAPDPDFRPIEYFDKEGVYRGAAADHVRLLEQKLGVRIRIVRLKNWDEVMDRFRKHEVDLLGAIVRTPNREKFALFSDPLVTVPGGIFTRREKIGSLTLDSLKGRRVAVVSNYTGHDVLSTRYPEIVLDVVPDIQTGLAKASLGMVDAYVENMANATWYLEEAGIANLRLAGTTDFPYQWCIGIRKDWPEIQGILNKGLAGVSEDERRSIVRRWIHADLGGWRPSRLQLAAGALVLLSVVLAGILLWHRALRREIASRTEMEQRWREACQRLQAVFDSVNDAIFIHDGNSGSILDVNRRMTGMYGFTREEVLRGGVGELSGGTPPHSDAEAREWLRKAREEGPQLFDWVARRKSGERFPVEVGARFEREAGDGGLFFVSVRDVSERRAAEEALRESEQRFRVLIESSPMGIHMYRLEEDGRLAFTGANPAADRILGVNHADFVGKPIEEAFPSLIGTEVPDRYRDICRGGEAWFSEQVDYEDARVRGAFGVTAFGTVPGSMAVMFQDVTERKRAEAHREKLEGQLRQSQKMEAIGRLAGGIAHDFNNMLTAILGFTDLLARKVPPDGNLARDLGEIRAAGEKAAEMTRQLLAFSRKQILQPRVIRLSDVVTDVQRMIGRLLGEDVRLSVHLASGTGKVLADPGQLNQVLLNLAVNARDAMPEGGVLTIETANVELDRNGALDYLGMEPGRYVVLSVSDNGIGMDAETRSRLFEPFFTTKEFGRGTGLGLATVHGIVSQSRGYIRVYSEPGRGTTFRIHFPRVEGEAEPKPSTPEAAPPSGTETVLLAEDAGEVRKLACSILSGLGYRILEAANGTEALELSRGTGERIHLLFTDVVMPGISGRALAETLAAERPGIRIAYTSGYTENAIAHHGVLDPGIRLLQKPFLPDDLARFIRDVLDEPVV